MQKNVELEGVEPSAFRMQSGRATTALKPRDEAIQLHGPCTFIFQSYLFYTDRWVPSCADPLLFFGECRRFIVPQP